MKFAGRSARGGGVNAFRARSSPGGPRRYGWRLAFAAAVAAVTLSGAGEGTARAASVGAVSGVAVSEAPAGPREGEGALEPAASRAGTPYETLSRSWHAHAGAPVERAAALRREALELGVKSFDAGALALLLEPGFGSPLERADAASQLAPNLPAAHAALARARLLDDRDPVAAAAAALRAVRAFAHHLEAALWGLGTAALLGFGILTASGIFFVALAAGRALPHAAHDLGDPLGALPSFARVALLGALVLLPLAAGEGLLGTTAVLLGIAFCYARSALRVALVGAALLVTLGIHPVAELTARALLALGSDPVAEAAYATERGLVNPLHLDRLRRAEGEDPLAVRALASYELRRGNLTAANARYERLLTAASNDPRVLNNAANARLVQGDVEAAIALYERALEAMPDAHIWFNLAQAYGQAIRVEEHEQAIARAQDLDGKLVRRLTEVLASREGGYVADLPLPTTQVLVRLLDAAAPRGAVHLRAPLAPGWLGRDLATTAAALLAAIVIGALARRRFEPSWSCSHCGRRVCPRCPSRPATDSLCQGCARLLQRPDTTDPSLRTTRIETLRRRARRVRRLRAAACVLVPGAAGLLNGRPILAFAAVIALAAGGGAALLLAWPVLPDPLSVGAAGPLALAAFATLGLGLHAVLTAAAALAGRS